VDERTEAECVRFRPLKSVLSSDFSLMKNSVIGLTMGDPGGIGPEVIAKNFRSVPSRKAVYLVIGSKNPFERLRKRLRFAPFHEVRSWKEIKKGKLNFWDTGSGAFDAGKVSRRNGAQALKALEFAAKAAAQGRMQALVTAPLNKTSMRLVAPGFHGHTEFLAKTARVKQFAMMFVGPRLKVTLVTIHEPVRKVSALITKNRVLEKILLTDRFMKKHFRVRKPKLAVCALNPHGRETGHEDEAQIRPAVQAAKRRGIEAFGPLSADQLFYDAYEGRYDAVISMYHDQGLAPFKMIAFRDGVNVTLGLPFVRTSPDHGTAFDIAYQNKAEAISFRSALRLAEKLSGL
jgi:4-hydroxythreonine-4-phosphate dehydrogenase